MPLGPVRASRAGRAQRRVGAPLAGSLVAALSAGTVGLVVRSGWDAPAVAHLLVIGLCAAVWVIVLWRAAVLVAEGRFGATPAAARMLGALAGVVPVVLAMADLVGAATAQRSMLLGTFPFAGATGALGTAQSLGRALALVALTATGYAVVLAYWGRARRDVGCGARSGRHLTGDIGRSAALPTLVRVEAVLTRRDPLAVVNVVILLVCAGTLALLPDVARLVMTAPSLLLLCTLAGVLSEMAYGRTRAHAWVVRMGSGRLRWVAPEATVVAALTTVLSLAVVLVVSRGQPGMPALALGLIAAWLAMSVGWCAGVLVPYSPASPGGSWITTALSAVMLGLVWLGVQHLGLIDRPALLVATVLVLGSCFVAVGVLVDLRREAIRL
ncbi:MAG: hypothetical protein L0H96_08575 [Humibacillus sp.]|nr:hypothetical protein [Humibacillus sp.]MDN5776950.1 hypothetical protein [Humibacillus sp.]